MRKESQPIKRTTYAFVEILRFARDDRFILLGYISFLRPVRNRNWVYRLINHAPSLQYGSDKSI